MCPEVRSAANRPADSFATWRYHPVGKAGPARFAGHASHMARGVDGAIQHRDAADEGRLDACGNIIGGKVIVNEGKVVRPSQLIASVRRT